MNYSDLFSYNLFEARHIGSNEEHHRLLQKLGSSSLEAFVDSVLPESVRLKNALNLPQGMSEEAALTKLHAIAQRNKVAKSYIGRGYYPSLMPKAIVRNILENPGWYTAYTPYQAEVSQGRLEALLNFQQMCIDLTGLDIAGASLLDEATAAAEAMTMTRRVSKSKSNRFFVDSRVFEQTLDVVQTRAECFGFEVIVGDINNLPEGEFFGALLQLVGKEGDILDLTGNIAQLHEKGALVAVAADILALVLVKSPAQMGADIALGSTQRFGIPMMMGGPSAAYFAFKDAYKRSSPGRIIGVSVDASGKRALRMALQTREQHIRREKANSNICTSQVLLANLAGMYAVYHGAEGLKKIAWRTHALAAAFAQAIQSDDSLLHTVFFDTVTVRTSRAQAIFQNAEEAGFNLYLIDQETISVAFSEASTADDFATLCEIFTGEEQRLPVDLMTVLPQSLLRTDAILNHEVFQKYHSEHELLRYVKSLENKDISLTHSMISLGSCTMKLNAAAEMMPISWPEFAEIHPFAPEDQTQGYVQMMKELADYLKAITGFDAVCLQPNSGAQGEYTGMLAIRRYHQSRGEEHRHICLIPQSAHGTNPASAHLAGFEVVVVATDQLGNVDLDDLRAKAEQHQDHLAALMITYPSTHGVFEEGIVEICRIIHEKGAQVYMDGANMNAQVGLMQPAAVGADVLHMNLHKTFAIPHGGGGPGVGPIGLKSHLAPFVPSHSVRPPVDSQKGMGAVSASPYGSAGVMPISWMYITMMGADGLKKATSIALLKANYVASSLADDYPILYTGKNGRVAHECIVDLRPIKAQSGITEVDIAKRLMDYGFHAPTMSFPVPGTLMIEPTESESIAELDRFIAAMKQIKQEVLKVQNGTWSLEDNPLVNAPHTALCLTEEWHHPYSREEAVYPLDYLKERKCWPTVRRIDDVYGDRNLVCGCSM